MAAPPAFKLKGYDWIDIQPIIPDPSQQQKRRLTTKINSVYWLIFAVRPIWTVRESRRMRRDSRMRNKDARYKLVAA
jgi:hypothetical protein